MNRKKFGILFFCLAYFSGAFAQSSDANDPFENYNRHMYTINDTIDRAVFKPVATLYQTVTPQFVRTGVTNFFNNLEIVPTVVNDTLQANFCATSRDSWRFIINSTAGVGGLLDPATKLGFPQNEQDFGLTMARWGYTSSSYLILPLFGPSTVRDTLGLPVDYVGSAYPYFDTATSWVLTSTDSINERSNVLNYDNLRAQAFDPYVAIRNAYMQYRDNAINADINQNGRYTH
jgi:phospholipid-binding lipoprotein MlaA